MDVGNPSNAVRLFHYIGADNDVTASVVDSDVIRDMTDRRVCPHTACALYAAIRLEVPGSIVVRTADAAKFRGDPVVRARSPFVLHRPAALRKTCRVVLLIGMPGMGKTTLSFMLGGHDSDHTMVADRAKNNLPEVIATFDTPDAFIEYEGQTAIRMLQASIARDGTTVIATGGSAVHSEPLRRFLKGNGDVVVVWLSREPVDTDGQDWSVRGVVVPSDVVVTRPEHLTAARTPLYAELSDFELRTDMWDAQRCAVALQSAIRFLAK